MKTLKQHLCNQAGNDRNPLTEEDTFRFSCHPEVACFTRCCKDADMYLYPYDVVRLKNRLGISSDRFLSQYTVSAFRDNPYFPSVMLKMSDDEEKSCPFLSPKGCSVYEDRPFSCRAYPLERAVARIGNAESRTAFYFIAKHSHCRGHEESRQWTVKGWIEDQQLPAYHEMNDLWVDMDTLFRQNPWGPQGINGQELKMAFMACFNVDRLKAFILESTFLSRFQVSSNRVEAIVASDAERLKFGFEWVRFFLTGTGPLAGRLLNDI